jgi:hypothetical protein
MHSVLWKCEKIFKRNIFSLLKCNYPDLAFSLSLSTYLYSCFTMIQKYFKCGQHVASILLQSRNTMWIKNSDLECRDTSKNIFILFTSWFHGQLQHINHYHCWLCEHFYDFFVNIRAKGDNSDLKMP